MSIIYCRKDECKFCTDDLCIKTIVRIENVGCASFDPKDTEIGADKNERNIIDRKSY